MLHAHLVAKTAPVALPENTVVFRDYRVTVLGDRLFRVEKSPTGVFNDAATQSVWFRNVPAQSFTAKKKGNTLTVATDRAVLTIQPEWDDCTVTLDGVAHPLCNDEENLLGTARTLDGYAGDMHIQALCKSHIHPGVCSKSGVAVVDDTNSLCLAEDGHLNPKSADEKDVYVFAFGHDYRAAVQALFTITGKVPMLPRYAMGNWWSRYHRYTDEEYLYLMDQFEKHDIPMTVATVDMDWHYSNFVDAEKQISARGKATADRGCAISRPGSRALGWTGYSWNPGLFPDYKAFLKALHDRNLHITLNLHPRDGVRFFEDMYEEMAKAMGVDPSTEAPVEFDMTDPRFINAYFDILHRPYEKDGVDFWWIDWQQGTASRMAGLDPLWALNHYHTLDNAETQVRPLILSRYAGVGSHRYPIGFSGDTIICWDTLEYLPYFTANATNIGYTWWSHDIGGHMYGIKDDELNLRFLQFAVFNPINRLHCCDTPTTTHEPWTYVNGTGELSAAAMRLRHALIPYLYTCNYLTHTEGIGLMEPLYYRHPESPEAYKFKNEYFFGPSLLVAPITRPSEAKRLTSVKVWLPEGMWTDIFTLDTYEVPAGGAVYNMVRPLDSIPVLAKAGSVLPMGMDRGNNPDNPMHIEAKVFNGNGSFSMFEDEEGREAFTDFSLTEEGDTQSITVSMRGDLSVIPAGRKLTLTFPNIEVHNLAYSYDPVQSVRRDLVSIEVLADGKPIDAHIEAYGVVSVTISDLDPAKTYTVRVAHEHIDAFERYKRLLWNKLLLVETTAKHKTELTDSMKQADTILKIIACIRKSDLDEIDKRRLLENVLPE